jgi:hypothetical protein
MSARPTPLDVIRRGLDDSAIFGTEGAAASIEKALTEAGHLLPPWTCVGPDGTRYSVVHPDIVDLRPGPLDGLPLYARLLPVGVDSGGDLVAGQGGGGVT